ncbi:MAG: hypothetical protein HYT08_05095 [Candidatus Levybacteria bacterium]|nr:hypothetical protein [Candidatus Levybacteria bacterium]
MSRRTIILIIALVGITGILLAIALTQKKGPGPSVTKPSPQVQVPYAHTSLEISSNPVSQATSSGSSTYSLDVNINTETDKVTAVQLELSFDPKAISNVDVKPGTFFKNPAQLIKRVNAKDGTISYALGINPGENGIQGSGVVAEISYREIGQSGTYTQINFLPKTLVSAEGTDKSVLKKSIGSLIMLGGASPANSTKPATSGAIPQTTRTQPNPFQ